MGFIQSQLVRDIGSERFEAAKLRIFASASRKRVLQLLSIPFCIL